MSEGLMLLVFILAYLAILSPFIILHTKEKINIFYSRFDFLFVVVFSFFVCMMLIFISSNNNSNTLVNILLGGLVLFIPFQLFMVYRSNNKKILASLMAYFAQLLIMLVCIPLSFIIYAYIAKRRKREKGEWKSTYQKRINERHKQKAVASLGFLYFVGQYLCRYDDFSFPQPDN